MATVENNLDTKSVTEPAAQGGVKDAFVAEYIEDKGSLAKSALSYFDKISSNDDISKDDLKKFLKTEGLTNDEKAVSTILLNNFDIVDKMANVSSYRQDSLLEEDLNPLQKNSSERDLITRADLETLLATTNGADAKQLEGQRFPKDNWMDMAVGVSGTATIAAAGGFAAMTLVEDGAIGAAVVVGGGTAVVAGGAALLVAAGAYGMYKLAIGDTGKEIASQIASRTKMLASWL